MTETSILAAHRQRQAFVYIRQSSPSQVERNTESTRRQYALAARAEALGWHPGQITVVDEDLGLSGESADKRDGFNSLAADVALGRAGLVLGLEVSRLARNNADWYRLIDLCALTDTLIADFDGIYDPACFNDRLVLGMLCRAVHNSPYVGHVVMLGSMRELLSESLLAQNYMT